MIRHVKVARRRLLEALLAAPGHVLDTKEGSVSNEDHVEGTVNDDSALRAVNNTRENREAGRWRGVDVEHVAAAFLPDLNGGVDCFLDLGAVEVDGSAGGEVRERARVAEDVPQQRTGGGYLVDVEAWVEVRDGVEDFVEDPAF